MQLTKEQYEEVVRQVVQAVSLQQQRLTVAKKNTLMPIDIPVEVSARHVHLSHSDLELIFGKGHNLTPKRELSQTGEFLAEERVTLVGNKGVIENVAVLGPVRRATQVEVTIADCRKLGVSPVVKDSGDTIGTPGIVMAGTNGAAKIAQGVMVARRHIHMSPNDAEHYGVSDGQTVQVEINGLRPLIFGDVLVRVSSNFVLAMHIDTEEANSCALGKGVGARILAAGASIVSAKQAECFSQTNASKDLKVTEMFSGKLLTEKIISEYRRNKCDEIKISKKTIMTALACDYAKKYNIAVIRD